jgi:hypothetical protein
MSKKTRLSFFLFPILLLSLFCFKHSFALEIPRNVLEKSFNYSANEIQSGILATLGATTDQTLNFSLQVAENTISEETQINLMEISGFYYPNGPKLDENKKEVMRNLYSPVFEFNLATDDLATTSPILIFQRQRIDVVPTTSQFNLNDGTAPGATNMQRLVIHYFDQTLGAWIPLKTIRDLKNDTWSAIAPSRSVIFALFGIPNEFEAYVSWYGDALTPSSKWNCASNKYPIGSIIEVCRLDNLEKCVKIKVVSRGPYVDNRIVDLTHSAFSALGTSGSGIFQVRSRLASLATSENVGKSINDTSISVNFLNDLYYGLSDNPEVKRLQEFLISKGYLANGLNTGNYYSLTEQAVKKFQKDKKITPVNGRFGPKTRGAMNREIE